MSVFQKNQSVYNVSGNCRYRVKTAHRNGAVTVEALFHVTTDGADLPGYLGFLYRNQPVDAFRADHPSAANAA